MKKNHKQKVKIARELGGFNSVAWEIRKKAIAKRVQKKIIKIKKAIKIKKDRLKKEKEENEKNR